MGMGGDGICIEGKERVGAGEHQNEAYQHIWGF
jgi:hypothetical protein